MQVEVRAPDSVARGWRATQSLQRTAEAAAEGRKLGAQWHKDEFGEL